MKIEEIKGLVESLAWPLVGLVAVIVFLLFFRKEIAGFINRIRSVGKGGIETTSSAREEAAARTINVARQEFMENPQSITLSEQEKKIKDVLKRLGFESSGDAIDVLVRELARTQINYGFLDIYNIIYGSELRLLEHLNSISGSGYTDGELDRYIATVRAQFPNRPNTENKESFMSILLTSNLVTRNNNRYFITELGREFLAWIIKQGKSQNLPN